MRLMQDRVLGETVRKFFALFKQRDFNAKCVDVFFFLQLFLHAGYTIQGGGD